MLNEEQKEELWGLLSDYERYRIQLKNQKKIGFGKDKFTLNEYAYKQIPLKKYKNLKQWDKENYTYAIKHGQTHLDKKYKLYLFNDWWRLIENKKLIYGDIYSLHGYIFDRVSEKLNKFEDGLYPHSFKFNFIKNNDKRNTSTLKTKINAYGKEKELKEFQKFKMIFEIEILQPRIKKYILKNCPNQTYRIVHKKETFDNYHMFLFSDNKALKNCKFETFLDDFNRLKRDNRYLKAIEKKFYNYAKKYLLKNFIKKRTRKNFIDG